MARQLNRWTSVALVAALAVAVVSPALEGRERSKSGGSVRQSKAVSKKSVNVDRNTRVSRDVNVNVNKNVNVNTRGGYYGRPGGTVIKGEEGAVAVGRRGAVVVGEEGAVGVGRYGRVYGTGEVFEDNDGWKVAAGVAGGVAAGIAIGTMISNPPPTMTTVAVGGSNYYYADGVYYSRVAYGGGVQYQVINAPPGAMITTLPAGCTTYMRGNVAYRQCGPTYYQPVSGGFRVVAF